MKGKWYERFFEVDQGEEGKGVFLRKILHPERYELEKRTRSYKKLINNLKEKRKNHVSKDFIMESKRLSSLRGTKSIFSGERISI